MVEKKETQGNPSLNSRKGYWLGRRFPRKKRRKKKIIGRGRRESGGACEQNPTNKGAVHNGSSVEIYTMYTDFARLEPNCTFSQHSLTIIVSVVLCFTRLHVHFGHRTMRPVGTCRQSRHAPPLSNLSWQFIKGPLFVGERNVERRATAIFCVHTFFFPLERGWRNTHLFFFPVGFCKKWGMEYTHTHTLLALFFFPSPGFQPILAPLEPHQWLHHYFGVKVWVAL